MRGLTKYLLKYDKNFTLPKCSNKKCSCFTAFKLTINCRIEEPLPYVIQVEEIVKKYKRTYDSHYRLACLKLEKNSRIPGFVIMDTIREHFNTLSVFQDYLGNLQSRPSILTGLLYIHHLKTVFKCYFYIKKQMKILIGLFKKIGSNKMYPKLHFDKLTYFHLHTIQVFKKSLLNFEEV